MKGNTMISSENLPTLSGSTVIDQDGNKIGTLGQVYVDPQTGEPNWATVNTGFFGLSESFVPLSDATTEGDGTVRVAYSKEMVKDAPRIDADGPLDQDQEDELYRYYMGDSSSTFTAGTAGTDYVGSDYDDASARTDAGTTGHDTSGPNTDTAMTRSEEQLRVGKERVETGRARLRKYVVTEQQSVNVPVSREEVRLEREPITDENIDAAMSGPDISEEEHEVILSEERPVIDKETVPVERVRLDTDTVTENERVTDDVRREEIELEGDTRRDDDRL